MRVSNLAQGSTMYTSNAYLVRGDWNSLPDKNTLVDTGRDPVVLDNLEQAATGVGKPRVQQVVLTHGHYDHVGMLEAIRQRYRPVVYAFSPHLSGVDRVLRNGDRLLLGDCWFEVIHVPCHSQDSVCLYHPGEGVLFSGDTPLNGNGKEAGGLGDHPVRMVYPGHGGAYAPSASLGCGS
jgi:glyoxylase-like metal-dependent hydrolase (beta-lactamase superfamily II)